MSQDSPQQSSPEKRFSLPGEANWTNWYINPRKKQKQTPQHPHPEAIMTSNNPGSFHNRPQPTSQLHFQCQEKDPAFLRPKMPPVNSSGRTGRRDPRVAQNVGQSQDVPRTSNNNTALRTRPVYPYAAQIHNMTYEQVVSSILQFLGNDPQYMASVDPKQQKSSKSPKRTQNRKLQETIPPVPKKRTKNETQAIHPDNNTNYQSTSIDGQIRPRNLGMSFPTSSQPRYHSHHPPKQSPHLLSYHHS